MSEIVESEIVEKARAKINLTLRVHGRRPDGYHELESLVAFAGIGDCIRLRPVSSIDNSSAIPQASPAVAGRISVTGPFAGAIVGDNLIATAVTLVERAAGRLIGVDLVLEKHLPVASGIGGGSADAAAVLRALRIAYPELATGVDWMTLAQRLGADVPVCMASRSVIMTGIGERLAPLAMPALHAVLANPCVPVPPDKSRRVFAALAAPPSRPRPQPALPIFADWRAVIEIARRDGNDLDMAAEAVIPAISEVRAAVGASHGCLHALLSGGGPTVVGLYASAEAARDAAQALVAAHPAWWVRATLIGG